MQGPKPWRRCAPRKPGRRFPHGDIGSSIRRTAGYGPVCPVVWEGCSREATPYPDAHRYGMGMQSIGILLGPRRPDSRHPGTMPKPSFELDPREVEDFEIAER
jgi:hypothetical protein